MPTIDLSITITVIIGLAAIVSPVLTAGLNNWHQLQMRKLEYEHEDSVRREMREQEIFEGYIRAAGACAQHPSSDALREFGNHSGLAQYYVPDDVRQDMEHLEKIIHYADTTPRVELLSKIITELRKIKEPVCMPRKQKSHKWCKRRPEREKSSS